MSSVQRCSWIVGGRQCPETEHLVSHEGRWAEPPRLLCQAHKLEVLELLGIGRRTPRRHPAARQPRDPTILQR